MEEEVTGIVRRNGALRIAFASGRSMTCPAAALEGCPVSVGMRLDPEVTEKKIGKAAAACCLRQVLLWQSRRDHAAEEMRRRLVTMGYPADAADAAIRRLADCGAVSDTRYCESLVRRKKRSRGREALIMEMRAHGVEEETAAAALEKELDGPEEAESAYRFALRQLERGREKDKVFLGLRRRGYSHDLSMEALKKALVRTEEASEEEDFL